MKKMPSKEDLSVEISFLEGLRLRMPEDLDVLKLLGDDYTRVGRWEDGMSVDMQLAALLPDDPMIHYNLACSFSLLGNIEDAASTLNQAITLGYDDVEWMEQDPDLQNLRKSPEYNILAAKLKRSRKPQKKV